MDLSEVTDVFVQECDELLEGMEQTLLGLERGVADPDAVHSVFRAVHTIKGSSGMFGFERIEQFSHATESLLENIRTGGLDFTPELVRLLIESRDYLVRLVRVDVAGQADEEQSGLEGVGEDLLTRIQSRDKRIDPSVSGQSDLETETPTGRDPKDGPSLWSIDLRFGPDVFRQGLDPASFIRYLRELGRIQSVRTLSENPPALVELDPERCYLAFEIELESAASETEIRSVFEFVERDCEIVIRRDHGAAEQTAETAETTAPRQNNSGTLRVEAEKLDYLVNLVGELVISMGHLHQLADDSEQPEIVENSYGMLKLVSEIRDAAFGLRMFSIGTLFNRFRRAIRDIAAELQKDVRLVIEGAETRLDKNIVEKISDPLMHLVRNAIDHGIESREERLRAGKNPEGCILLNAYNEAGEIVIEITDDGAGLKRDKILRKAVERGLVYEGEDLSDERVFRLIFQPGMSTAEEVTSLSGRGVGMDVVQRNIEALRGRIELQSAPDRGTTVRIRLPLTLAIIDGFLVRVSTSYFILPLDLVDECVEFSPTDAAQESDMMATRSGALPVIRLKDFFQLEKPSEAAESRESLVVVKQSGDRTGLLVDELIGEYQTVVKPMGPVFNGLRALSGATILGGGTIAIVIDVPSLLQWYNDEVGRPVQPVDLRGIHKQLEGITT